MSGNNLHFQGILAFLQVLINNGRILSEGILSLYNFLSIQSYIRISINTFKHNSMVFIFQTICIESKYSRVFNVGL